MGTYLILIRKKKIKMEKLNSICLNIRVAFRKRDKDSMILFSNMLWEHLDNEGWKVSEDYWVYNDKHLLDRGIACTIQSFMFSDSSYDGKKRKYAFMIQAMFELCRGLRFDSNSKYMRAEYAYWFFFCFCSNISLLQSMMEATLKDYKKTVNDENMLIIPFLILNLLNQFCIEKDNIEMTYTPLFDTKNGLDEKDYLKLFNQYQDIAIPLLQEAESNPNIEFNLESLEQESELVYEFFLRYVMLGQSSSIYKSIIKYQEL